MFINLIWQFFSSQYYLLTVKPINADKEYYRNDIQQLKFVFEHFDGFLKSLMFL